MNIVSAMKARKRLVSQLQRVRNDIREANRVVIGEKRDVDIEALIAREAAIFEKMIELRRAIAVTNAPIWGDLMRMIEIKGKIGYLRGIPTKAGKDLGGRRSFMMDEAPDVEWEVHLAKADVDTQISDLERHLATLQDGVDQFNAQTEIDVEIPPELLF